jgi:hypothetical protein
MPRLPRRRITKPKHDLWQTHFDRPNQAGLRDVTHHGESYAARGDRPGLTVAIRHTTTPSGHVNKSTKTPEAPGGILVLIPDAFLRRPADAFSLRR